MVVGRGEGRSMRFMGGGGEEGERRMEHGVMNRETG